MFMIYKIFFIFSNEERFYYEIPTHLILLKKTSICNDSNYI